jgi:hypothetical protein
MQPDTKRIERWAWTICLAFIAFTLGGFGGYYARPFIDGPDAQGSAGRPVALVAPPANPVANPPFNLMKAAVSRTRHWKGDPNAPVTIAEYGDFQ